MRAQRSFSSKNRSSQLKKSHIIEASLDKKQQLISKYQTQINDLIDQIDSKQTTRKQAPLLNTDKSARKRALSSLRKQTAGTIEQDQVSGSLKDYNKLILGLEYALESERRKNQDLVQKNTSLESEISNLRNLLMGPDEQKSYEKTAYKESQDKITYLEGRIIEQKKNYEFIIDAKNQTLTALQIQLKSVRKNFESTTANSKDNDQNHSKRIIDLMAQIQQLKHLLNKKNIVIEKIKYNNQPDEESDDQQLAKLRRAEKLKFYSEQLQISNKLIMRKNVQILSLSNKIMLYEKVLDVMEQYLDKKEVRGVDLSILEQPCVNKLRILLREKAVFERQLLNQLNEHNKKIALFETELTGRDRSSNQKLAQLVNDNKRLANTVANLQTNLGIVEKDLQTANRQKQMLSAQITINKRQFVQEVTKLKDQLGQISSVTKNQFDRMKLQNIKLAEQNRSLLFLVGEKQRQLHKKGETLKTFEQYREKINSLGMSGVSEKQKRRVQSVASEQITVQKVGTKIMTINNFSSWLFEWNKVKNWNNKRTLLNLILDREQIKATAMDSVGYLVNVIHECFLQSKNLEIQERGTILLAHFVGHGILRNQALFLNKLLPIAIRSFRGIIEGQQQSRHRLLNESALKIITALQPMGFKWTSQLTNQMLAVNGLKYIFTTIRNSTLDELVEQAYNVLILIARHNQMISFMQSFDLNTLIFSNLSHDYTFIIFLLTLVRCLLEGGDYLKAQASLLEYRKLFDLLAGDDDQELLELGLDCLLLLMDKSSLFTKSVEKIRAISIVTTMLRRNNEEASEILLKKAGKAYMYLLTELQTQNMNRYVKSQIDKLLQVVKLKKFNEFRFTRIMKLLPKIAALVQDSPELDQKLIQATSRLYENYQSLELHLRIRLNQTTNTIFQRNKQLLNKYSNETLITHIVEAYKIAGNQAQLLFLLKIILFQTEQKRTTQVLRSGRESLLAKITTDALMADYNVTILVLRVLLMLVKEKYSEKFITQAVVNSVVNKILNERGEEQYIGLALSVLYFMCKVESLVSVAFECGVVARLCNVIVERHNKQQVIFKSLAVLQTCHSLAYKKRILNYLIVNDNSLQILKSLNNSVRRAKNKLQMGNRCVFLYDYLNNTTAVESLAVLTERNEWLVEDLILLRNEYVGVLDPLVYKIEMLLHEMSSKSAKVRKIYERFRVEGGVSEDEN